MVAFFEISNLNFLTLLRKKNGNDKKTERQSRGCEMSHIFVFGPSCGGKSTLAKQLHATLGDTWTYVDRDELIEQSICDEANADRVLDQKIKEIKDRVIIDAQIPWRERKEGELYFLVLPPLHTLLERDDNRTVFLKRCSERALRARNYVIETYDTLSQLPKEMFNRCLDSSQLSVEEEIQQVNKLL
jgi:adenylate kinase family enzyme